MVVRLRGGGEQRTRPGWSGMSSAIEGGEEEREWSTGVGWCALCVTGEDQRGGVDSLARSFVRSTRASSPPGARARQREHHVHERRDPFPTSFFEPFFARDLQLLFASDIFLQMGSYSSCETWLQ